MSNETKRDVFDDALVYVPVGREYDPVNDDEAGDLRSFLSARYAAALTDDLPVIPKEVADWIEKCKHDGVSVGYMLCYERQPEKVRDWIELTNGTYEFNQKRYAEYQDLVARAWLDGYTVEGRK
ncbi:DUF1642 domain-containing protein [Lactiplantibacillus plantarum]|uniref:DUF1642 domain-containing protein n=1 Tax=Lactiplantibacillus plantarum TaxID=1590 RepID=UPI0007B561F3|nr:DUF1642 domain-containing protein [Lactiplantibacillus plantarum]KZU54448.1 Prophage Lp1 protein 31 [Lactiplantibacillus plantarum]